LLNISPSDRHDDEAGNHQFHLRCLDEDLRGRVELSVGDATDGASAARKVDGLIAIDIYAVSAHIAANDQFPDSVSAVRPEQLRLPMIGQWTEAGSFRGKQPGASGILAILAGLDLPVRPRRVSGISCSKIRFAAHEQLASERQDEGGRGQGA